jgi:Ca-activated chloride channel family protein
MTDELDRLGAALRAQNPTADAATKAQALAAAVNIFNDLQGMKDGVRPTGYEAQPSRLRKGLLTMFETLTSRPALLTTSSLVVVAIGLFAIQPLDLMPGNWAAIETEEAIYLEEKVEADGRSRNLQTDVNDQFLAEPEVEFMADAPAQAPSPALLSGLRKSSDTSNFAASGFAERDFNIAIDQDREQFANGDQNPLRLVIEDPVSTFSIDVDTASYALVRDSIMNGYLPPKDAVRVEEMVNYFSYDYTAPTGEHPFATNISVIDTPWNSGTKLVHIGIQGEVIDDDARPPLDLVFLIDTSGSMESADKLPLLRQSLGLMLSKLRPEDRVAIVTYAGSSGVALEPTSASETGKIRAALNNLQAGGSTAGHAGLEGAYALAEDMHEDGRLGRVILATDGDFNVGLSGTEELTDYIAKKRDSGTYLNVLGFGRGNINDAVMQALAQNGNGQASYIDTLSEARKVLVDQMAGALFPIANDVKIQVEFNPAVITEYRLIGYETRGLKREDFNNDKVDAGEIGAGTQVTAIYEVTPVGSAAVQIDPSRYQAAEATTSPSDELGFIKLRYKSPGSDSSVLISQPIANSTVTASRDAKFAVALAGFGELLRGSQFVGDWGFWDAVALAREARGEDPYGYRAEAINLMRLAQNLSQ